MTAGAAGDRAALAALLRGESSTYARFGSPLYAALTVRAAEDVEAGGPVWDVLGGLAQAKRTHVPLHLFGAVHRLVLEGRAPDLAAHFPSSGGDGNADGAWDAIRKLLTENGAEVRRLAQRPIQTNEPGRSAALLGGFLTIARETGLPLALLEIGTSAGLNLRWDRYRYESKAGSWGPEDSPVLITDVFVDAAPPLNVAPVVFQRSGCDAQPVDVSTDEGRLTLMSYVWPDQATRFEALKGAIAVAATVPASIVHADAIDWLSGALAERRPGVATVVFHSAFIAYLDAGERARLESVIAEAAGRANSDAPLSVLTLEPIDEGVVPPTFGVRLRMWPRGSDELLAIASAHGPPVRWLA